MQTSIGLANGGFPRLPRTRGAGRRRHRENWTCPNHSPIDMTGGRTSRRKLPMTPMTGLRIALISVLWSGSLFFLFPALAIELNETAQWPRWQAPAMLLAGCILIVIGILVLVWATRIFRTEGEGTPVPTDPPSRLVSSGLYQYSRNPIYLADVAILLGIFLARGHLALLLYAGLVFLGLHAWVVVHEEPRLRDRLGEDWEAYVQRVLRWFGGVGHGLHTK